MTFLNYVIRQLILFKWRHVKVVSLFNYNFDRNKLFLRTPCVLMNKKTKKFYHIREQDAELFDTEVKIKEALELGILRLMEPSDLPLVK